MQFTTSSLLLAGAALLTKVSADGVFSMNATAVPSSYVSLVVLNGNVGDPPVCNSTATIAGLPATGDITCNAGYALSFSWATENDGIQATYTTPSASPFTYNVPRTAFDGTTYTFGFYDYFPDAAAAKKFVEFHA